jgi:adenine phosphoribosyltransferase
MTSDDLRALIRDVPDFPQPGIVFKDMMPLIADPTALHASVDLLAEWAGPRSPDVILGAEARGFIFGGALAYRLGCGFVPARKPGKLPWRTVEATYDLEYGQDTLQVHADALGAGSRVIVLDDVLATGGTAAAKAALVEKMGGRVAGFAFLLELDFLHGREKLGDPRIVSLIHVD